MYQTEREYLEDEFYTRLELTCIACHESYSPMEFADWATTGNDELDASKLKEVYAPRALEMGWSTNSDGDAQCPKCSSRNT
jgi:hypothetical protein